jgi:hypothetical protein
MAEDNHYIPIFYQKRWAVRVDKCVCVYSRPHKEIHVQRKHPRGVGFQPDLYTVPNTDPAVASYLERQFFQATDDLASKALAVIEAGEWSEPMGTDVRSGWTRFIMSLLHRNPERIAESLQTVSRYVTILKPQYERRYHLKQDASSPATFEEYWQVMLPEILDRTGIRLIQTSIDTEFAGQHFNNLLWRVLDFKSSLTFLTGDRPIIMTNGMIGPDSHLAIPIGPRKLFIAAHTSKWADALMRDRADNAVAFVNDKIARQARRFCIGIDDSHKAFFGKRFGEMLPGSPFDTLPPPTDEELAQLASEIKEVDADPADRVAGK